MEILITGNTGYLTDSFLKKLYPEDHVVINGSCAVKASKNIRKFNLRKREENDRVLGEYEFERIIYFSQYLTLHGDRDGELDHLRRILQYCEKRKAQFLYIVGPEGNYQETTGKTVLVSAAENLSLYYSENRGIDLKILRIPYLYAAQYPQDSLAKLFRMTGEKKAITLLEAADQPAYFINMDDLGELLYRIFDTWIKGTEILSVPDVFHITFGQIGEALKKEIPDANITYSGETAIVRMKVQDDGEIRGRYGWFPRFSILDDIPEQYEVYQSLQKKRKTKWETCRSWIGTHQKLMVVLEAGVLFLAAEWLNRLSGSRLQFQFIDIRLLYIVIMGTIHGINAGLFAALLSSLSLIMAYLNLGTNWLTLFYEPSNWLPFIFYFIVGSICGYVQMKNRSTIEFVTKENELLREKFNFTRELYQDIVQERRNLKRQILVSRDSFGKIFNITRKLDSVRPQEIFMRTVQVLEDILENNTIQIYSFGRNSGYGRLEASSADMGSSAARSFKVDDHLQELEVIKQGKIWVNKLLNPEKPSYMVGIMRKEQLILLIMIRNAPYEQMTLFYENLLRILCGLVETTLLRAIQYEESIYREQHVGETLFMKASYFRDKLALCHSMKEERLVEYSVLLLNLNGMTLEDAEQILSGMIRENDTVGLFGQERLYLILHQSSDEQAGIVMERLKRAGLESRLLSMQEETKLREGVE